MKLSVVIVNYNVKYYLEQCLHSLYEALEGIESEVVVVDNASIDGAEAYITPKFPQLKWIQNSDNKGFSKANNQGILRTTGEYVLVLHPDTMIPDGVIRQCLNFMDAHSEAGSVGVRLLHSNGAYSVESRRLSPQPIPLFYKVLGLATLFPHSCIFGRYYCSRVSSLIEQDVDILPGVFILFRRKAGAEIGFMDEGFYLFGVDIEFSYSLQKKGWKNYYLPIPILHYKGESVDRESFRYNYWFYRSILIFFKKHYVHYNWLSLPIRIGIYVKATSTWLFNQKRRIARWLRLEKRIKKKAVFFFIGSTDMLSACRALCNEHHLNGRFFNIDEKPALAENGHNELRRVWDAKTDEGTTVYVVYDMDHFSVERVLGIFSAHPSSHVRLGTYSLSRPVLLTDRYIFT